MSEKTPGSQPWQFETASITKSTKDSGGFRVDLWFTFRSLTNEQTHVVLEGLTPEAALRVLADKFVEFKLVGPASFFPEMAR